MNPRHNDHVEPERKQPKSEDVSAFNRVERAARIINAVGLIYRAARWLWNEFHAHLD